MIGADRWIRRSLYRRWSPSWWRDIPVVPFRLLRHMYQRAVRGYSTYDLANHDNYLADVIATVAFSLFAHSDGHPIGLTHEEWLDILLEIYDGFAGYGDEEIPDMAFDLLHDWFTALWN